MGRGATWGTRTAGKWRERGRKGGEGGGGEDRRDWDKEGQRETMEWKREEERPGRRGLFKGGSDKEDNVLIKSQWSEGQEDGDEERWRRKAKTFWRSECQKTLKNLEDHRSSAEFWLEKKTERKRWKDRRLTRSSVEFRCNLSAMAANFETNQSWGLWCFREVLQHQRNQENLFHHLNPLENVQSVDLLTSEKQQIKGKKGFARGFYHGSLIKTEVLIQFRHPEEQKHPFAYLGLKPFKRICLLLWICKAFSLACARL